MFYSSSCGLYVSLITTLIIKVSLDKAAFASDPTAAINSPQDLTESRTSRTPAVNFNNYVALLDILKQELNNNKDISSDEAATANEEINQGMSTSTLHHLPILSEILEGRVRTKNELMNRKYQIQTLKLLEYGLNAVKRPSSEDALPQSDEFPRDSRAARQMMSTVDPELMGLVLQRWRHRLEDDAADGTDANVMYNIDDILSNDRNSGKQDISVRLDLDTLSAMVDNKRRKNYHGKLQSTLRKLNVIGKK